MTGETQEGAREETEGKELIFIQHRSKRTLWIQKNNKGRKNIYVSTCICILLNYTKYRTSANNSHERKQSFSPNNPD
ncbi:hypothetical protein C922_05607 [Plasmodium inui San Antonio 1]|uniref:Uncharacterized protein n=1 Tax=Plasmodium inui San Antonio 1 TaxID=1237626 RepID=W6ZT03_9APIC|nr:hypothetical protein C922_05607 [Plasmodium inui San Antonio 1]EUD64012.1 hypothetical protein C922_05607 [Plasmodium inui San Antonio 1]